MNNSLYHIEHHSAIPKEYEAILFEGISRQAYEKRGLSPIKAFSIFIKDAKDTIVGGLSGTLFYGCQYIDSLWIDTPLRSQRWGTKLMQEAENLGLKHSVSFITLSTMDWEALAFYQKLGFLIEFTREGYENGSKMYMLRKNL